MKNRNGKIFVFGDSHALFWDGTELPNTEKLYPDIVVHHLGPVLAWNVKEKALPEIRRILNESPELPDCIFLSFGEIDVRTGRPHPEECARRLVDAAKSLSVEFETEVFIVTPPPPSDDGRPDPLFPVVGEIASREYRLRRFTGALDYFASAPQGEAKVSLIAVAEALKSTDGIFSDGTHLSRVALEKLVRTSVFAKYFVNKVS